MIVYNSYGYGRKAVRMKVLKTRIHEYRKEAGITQEKLATMVGVRRETIGALENGRYNPSLRLAVDIAKAFGVAVEEVFFYKEVT